MPQEPVYYQCSITSVGWLDLACLLHRILQHHLKSSRNLAETGSVVSGAYDDSANGFA